MQSRALSRRHAASDHVCRADSSCLRVTDEVKLSCTGHSRESTGVVQHFIFEKRTTRTLANGMRPTDAKWRFARAR